MNFESAERSRETATPVGSSELAEGLMLLRASTLKMIRLQLAMERRDRHVALETVDDLVALDRQLRDYLEGIPASGDQLMLRRALDGERAALNREKLTLAAEVLRRPANPTEPEGAVEAVDDWLGPPDLKFEPEERRTKRWWLAIVLIIAAGVGAVLYFVGIPDITTWLAAIAGAIR